MGRVTDRQDRSDKRRVELNVRSLSSRTGDGVQERAIRRVRRLDAGGALDSFAVRVWGEQVGLSTTAIDTDRGQQVLERIGSFRRWANRSGVSLDPFFDSRVTTSRVTGEEYARLRLPVVVMAEYVDGDVVHVTPHEADGSVRTVEDRLDRLDASVTEEPREPLRP